MKKNLRIVYLLLFLSAFFMHTLQGLAVDDNSDKDDAKSSAKIAVAVVGDSDTSKISDKTGRAPYFLIFDCSGSFIKAIKNPAQDQRGGVSSSVIALLKKESVKTLIAVKFGAKMENNLKAAGIEYRQHSGIAKEVVETVIKSKRSKDAQK
jgi:predicted Fe-Mo cluster-binding NifX family protein